MIFLGNSSYLETLMLQPYKIMFLITHCFTSKSGVAALPRVILMGCLIEIEHFEG